MPNTLKPKKYSTQLRFTVPDADTVVFEWIKSQHNLSNSLRTLIKQFIATNGFTDSTCAAKIDSIPVQVGGVSAPTGFPEPSMVAVVPTQALSPQSGPVNQNTQAVQPAAPVQNVSSSVGNKDQDAANALKSMLE